MKRYLLLSFVTLSSLTCFSAAEAQIVGNASPVGLVQGVKIPTGPWIRAGVGQGSEDLKISRIQSTDIPISYFDQNAPIHNWTIPAQWGGGLAMIALTERITLPAPTGFADSIHLVFDQMTGDSIAVLLDPDTVIESSDGFFYHLDETVFDPTVQSYAIGVLYPNQLQGQQMVSVSFPHVAVPKNFHVVLVPSNNGVSITSSFIIRGDSEATRLRTLDNTHSTFIGVNLQNSVSESGVIDSNLTPNGDAGPIFSNLYITAFVQPAFNFVETQSANSQLSIFPNPVGNSLNFSMPPGVEASSFEMWDLLGRVVLSAQPREVRTLDVSGLEPGRYEAILHTSEGVKMAPVIITH